LVATEYIDKREKDGLAKATVDKARWVVTLLEPSIGGVPLQEIGPELLLAALKGVEGSGRYETARRARSVAGQIFRYGQMTGRTTTSNPAAVLRGALVAPKPKHYSAILDQGRLAAFLKAADDYSSPVTRLALKILPHVFVRPGELRFATWDEIDFEKAEWTIAAERTKMRRPHRVPLSLPVQHLLREAHELTGPEGFIFPASHTRKRPLSENTMNHAMRRMGFKKSEATAHGFRSTASTHLNESGHFRADVIERALGHAPASEVRAAYHRGDHWRERVELAEWWSAFLENLLASR
jgi:integrase